MILNSIRRIKKEFAVRYGKIVICTDNSNYWRKSAFEFYKANRKKTRDESGIDWHEVFKTLNELRDELRDFFPYKVMNVPLAEADDVIGVIAKTFHLEENILIVSGDKDFQQLQVFPNIDQYSPVKKEFLRTPDPIAFLKEHILRGDPGDGVPNYLSPDNVLVTHGVRQKPILSAKVEKWLKQEPEEFCDEMTLAYYNRNRMLVDLNQIPCEVQEAILAEFAVPIKGNTNRIFNYLATHRMKDLLEVVSEF